MAQKIEVLGQPGIFQNKGFLETLGEYWVRSHKGL